MGARCNSCVDTTTNRHTYVCTHKQNTHSQRQVTGPQTLLCAWCIRASAQHVHSTHNSITIVHALLEPAGQTVGVHLVCALCTICSLRWETQHAFTHTHTHTLLAMFMFNMCECVYVFVSYVLRFRGCSIHLHTTQTLKRYARPIRCVQAQKCYIIHIRIYCVLCVRACCGCALYTHHETGIHSTPHGLGVSVCVCLCVCALEMLAVAQATIRGASSPDDAAKSAQTER